MSAHTPGRLEFCVNDPATAYDLFIPGGDGVTATAERSVDARRLAACWNVLEDCSTEMIEQTANAGWMVQDIIRHSVQVRIDYEQTQRELAAARALLREVMAADHATMAVSGQSIDEGVAGVALTARIGSYLDVVDTLEGGAP